MGQSFHCERAQGVEATLRSARLFLERFGIETAALDARLLFSHATGLEFAAVLLAPKLELQPQQHAAFGALITRRGAGEPVARIIGSKEFWGLEFALNSHTLVPRPDSETVIETVLQHLTEQQRHTQPLRILDLGTGTGCLLAAVLSEVPLATGVGVDLSPEAAHQAQHNMLKLGLSDRAEIVHGSWFDPVTGVFDVIVSNPPYIASAEMDELSIEVRCHDPRLALTPEGDGLEPYRTITAQAHRFLSADGILVFEHGSTQAAAVTEICLEAGFCNPKSVRDLAGHNRVVLVQKAHDM